MFLAGLDIGTTGCKITVYDQNGAYQYRSYCEYPASRNAGSHEIQAESIWNGVKRVLKDAAGKYPEMEAIGITSFGESCVLLDDRDQPLCPIMLYTDPRGSEECRELEAALGKERIQSITGVNPHPMYSLPKLMWRKKHQPEIYGKTRRIFMMEDYVIYLLTGEQIIDYSLCVRSMAFDIRKLTWSEELFEAAGIDRELFARPVRSGTCAARLKPELAREFGLSEKTILVPVGHDQVAAAIGAGVFDEATAVDGAGTVECITPVFEGIPKSRIMGEGGYAIVPYVLPGKYVTYAFSFTGGALVSWYVQQMAKLEMELAKEQGSSVYDILEKGMTEKPTGILVLPHFAGAGTPYMDEKARGAMVGLTIEHTTSDVYKAMMEGVAYEMRLNLETLKEAGICPTSLRATGGGASSRMWMQMKADILNLPMTSLGSAEAGAAGCAMMAGIAAGVFSDLPSAAKALIQERETYYPRKEIHEAYMVFYEKYKKLYQALRPLDL